VEVEQMTERDVERVMTEKPRNEVQRCR